LRRMEASSVGCEGQLVDLRSVPCEMHPENIFHFYDERRLAGEDACCFVSQPRYAQRTRRSRREWMVSSPSMRLKNAIGKTNPPAPRSARAQSGPSPDQRFAGNRAHGRSKCEGARSSALPFRARPRESAARGRADSNARWLHSAALQRSAAVVSRAK